MTTPVSPESTPAPRHKGIYVLPNLITLAALFGGFYAIVMSMNGRFDLATLGIFAAMVLDSLDGRVARLTNTQSAFGEQMDSLSDMVSFGAAPALIAYEWVLRDLGRWGWIAAFVYVSCAALRLARFNTQIGSVDKRWFIGLNSPSSAGMMMSFVWAMNEFGWTGQELRYIALALTVACGLLMVSRFRYASFKGSGQPKEREDRIPFGMALVMVAVLVALFIDPPRVLLLMAGTYAASGPLYWLWLKLKPKSASA